MAAKCRIACSTDQIFRPPERSGGPSILPPPVEAPLRRSLYCARFPIAIIRHSLFFAKRQYLARFRSGRSNMPNISNLYFRTAVLFLIAGIGLGLMMSISGNHNVIGAHAHINLLGWVTSALFG